MKTEFLLNSARVKLGPDRSRPLMAGSSPASTKLKQGSDKKPAYFKIKSDFIFYYEKRLIGFIQTKNRETGPVGFGKPKNRVRCLDRQDRQKLMRRGR